MADPSAARARLTPARWRGAVGISLVGGVIRLCIAALTPLFPDETYYWEWSRHLAAGYFDHPPLVALSIRFGTLLFGDTPLGVRFGPVLAGVIGTLFLAAAARRVAGDAAALLAAVIFTTIPLAAAGLILATPDAPLLAAAAAVIYCLVRALASRPQESFAWWLTAGVALGVAFSSKYTSALLPAGVLVAFIVRHDLRPRLREPGPYVAVAVALIVFAPVVAWNGSHDWISFAFQLRHGLNPARGSVLGREAELLGGQIGLVSPILFVMLVIAVARASSRPRREIDSALAALATVIFAFFMYSATKRRAEANWPALAYVPAVVLLASTDASRTWRRWLAAGVGLAGLLTVISYVDAFTPVLPVPARRDPAARAYGWDALARAVDAAQRARDGRAPGRTWVAADRYQESSELAFLLPGKPETFSLNLANRANQYDLWPAFRDRARPGDALVLALDDMAGPHPAVGALTPHFGRVSDRGPVTIARDGDPVKHMRIWVLDGWRGTWPGSK